MKKYITACVSGLFLLISHSCRESNLDVKPQFPTESTYFENESQFDEGVLGVYSKLVFFHNYRAEGFVHGVRLLPDDDLTTTGNDASENFSSLNSGNGKVADYFRFLYQLVGRANAVLELQAAKADQVYENQTLRQTHRGELLFLRAYGNFQLWNLFGTAPLMTERVVNESNLFPANSTGTQLLDQAITDLTEAASLLPSSWPDSMKGRITAAAAKGMLGKAYLFRATVTQTLADYTAALAQFDQIITGNDLVANFGDNFDANTENNQESLFEIQLGDASGGNNYWLNTDDFGDIGELSGFWGFFGNGAGDGYLYSGQPYVPTQSIRNAFSPADPRHHYTLTDNGAKVNKYVLSPGMFPEWAPGSTNNARVLRYADVYLMKAEALVQSNGATADAIALINQVRARARNSVSPAAAEPADRNAAETDRATIMNWIREERRLELAFEEGHRWFDLRRWHLGGQIDLKTWNFGSLRTDFRFEEKNLYLPIPSSEIQINTNLKQNAGY